MQQTPSLEEAQRFTEIKKKITDVIKAAPNPSSPKPYLRHDEDRHLDEKNFASLEELKDLRSTVARIDRKITETYPPLIKKLETLETRLSKMNNPKFQIFRKNANEALKNEILSLKQKIVTDASFLFEEKRRALLEIEALKKSDVQDIKKLQKEIKQAEDSLKTKKAEYDHHMMVHKQAVTQILNSSLNILGSPEWIAAITQATKPAEKYDLISQIYTHIYQQMHKPHAAASYRPYAGLIKQFSDQFQTLKNAQTNITAYEKLENDLRDKQRTLPEKEGQYAKAQNSAYHNAFTKPLQEEARKAAAEAAKQRQIEAEQRRKAAEEAAKQKQAEYDGYVSVRKDAIESILTLFKGVPTADGGIVALADLLDDAEEPSGRFAQMENAEAAQKFKLIKQIYESPDYSRQKEKIHAFSSSPFAKPMEEFSEQFERLQRAQQQIEKADRIRIKKVVVPEVSLAHTHTPEYNAYMEKASRAQAPTSTSRVRIRTPGPTGPTRSP